MKRRILLDFPLLVFGSVWILLFTAGRNQWFKDPGSFFHTVVGQYILETGSLFHTDSFSFTRFGEPWIAQQWLGEIIMAVFHRIAGLDGLFILTVSLIALLYSILASRIETSRMNLALGALILFLSLAAGSHHFHARPHIVTLLFMAVLYARLSDIETGKTSLQTLLWLIPMFVIWTNTHGGVLGGLFTLFLTAAGWTCARGKGWSCPIPHWKHLAGLWALVALLFATPLINPYGMGLPATWLEIMGSRAVSELIDEHASVWSLLLQGGIASYLTVTLLLYLGFFYIALLAGTDKKDRKVTWYIALVWLVLSLSRIRHAPIFAVLAVVAIAEIFPHCRWVHRLGNRGLFVFRTRKSGEGSRKSPFPGYVVAAIVTAAALIALHGSAQLPSTAQKWVKLDGAHWPLDVLPELQALERSHPQGSPIFNDMLFGGFLIFHAPNLRVFIDDRCELYGDEFLFRYVKADRSDFETWEKAYRFDLALLSSDSNYRKYFEADPAWRIVKRCASAILFEKTHHVTYGGNG